MTSPRRCPLCGADYLAADPRSSASSRDHTTVQAAHGGTPSPWRPTLPGRILTLRCSSCAGLYEWDSFASRQVE